MNEKEYLEKIVEDILFYINSKKLAINDFKEKYLNQTLYVNNIKYSKERKGSVTIKINAINEILDLFQETISLSIKAIVILLIKNKTNNNINYNFNLNKFINNNKINKNLNSNSYNCKKLKFKDYSNTDNKINLTKNNIGNKTYFNQTINKEGNRLDNSYNKYIKIKKNTNINNLKKRLMVDDNNSNNKIMNKTDLLFINQKNKINTNFNNYIKNIQENITTDSNFYNGYTKNDMSTQKFSKLKKYYVTESNNNITNNNNKCNFIKIKNSKFKIKSPLKQSLRDIVQRQKIKGKAFNFSSNNLKRTKTKIIENTIIKKNYKDDDVLTKLNDKTKFNDFKLFFAEKYGSGNYINFLNKYKTNKLNKIMIENELQILSKIFKNSNNKCITEKIPHKNNFSQISYSKGSERITENYRKKNNNQKEYRFKTPKTREYYRRKIIKESALKKNNSLKMLNNKMFSFLRNSTESSNKRSKNTIEKIDKNS